jgi:hypothetical protein
MSTPIPTDVRGPILLQLVNDAQNPDRTEVAARHHAALAAVLDLAERMEGGEEIRQAIAAKLLAPASAVAPEES